MRADIQAQCVHVPGYGVRLDFQGIACKVWESDTQRYQIRTEAQNQGKTRTQVKENKYV